MDTDNNAPQNSEGGNNDSMPEPTVTYPSQNGGLEQSQASQPSSTPLPISNSQMQHSAKKKKSTVIMAIVLGIFLLLGGSAAAYFGYIVPNQPENIWKSALANTAGGYDEMVNYFDEVSDTKGFKARGNLELSGAINGDGSIESEGDEKSSRTKIDFGFAGSRYGAEVLLNVPDGSETPDMYLKVNGLQGLGDLLGPTYGDFGLLVNGLDDQWIFVDHTLFDQMLARSSSMSEPGFTADDAFEIARKIGEANEEYLLNTDESKRVLTVVREVGREERDGRKVYHFEVGFNKENLKNYVRDIKNRLKDTKLRELLESSGQSYDEAFDIEGMISEIDELSGNETADVWVDMKTKLVEAVRFTDDEKEDNYLEIRMPYDGGSEIPFLIVFNVADDEDPGVIEFGVNVNKDTDVIKFSFDMNYELNGQKQTVNGELTTQPSNNAVEFTKPEGAKSITEILGALYSGLGAGLDMSQPTDFGTDVPIGGLEL